MTKYFNSAVSSFRLGLGGLICTVKFLTVYDFFWLTYDKDGEVLE
jgi:hypothetical protein